MPFTDLLLQWIANSHILFILFILFLAYLFDIRTDVISHWHHTFDMTNFSTQEFYETLGNALTARNIPEIKMYSVVHNEKIFLGAKREYFRVTWKQDTFDICAAPYGEGFYVSWWFVERTSRLYRFLKRFPLIKYLYTAKTYHRIDLEQMVEDLIHTCVLQSIDIMTGTPGSTLSESERAIIRMPSKMR